MVCLVFACFDCRLVILCLSWLVLLLLVMLICLFICVVCFDLVRTVYVLLVVYIGVTYCWIMLFFGCGFGLLLRFVTC